MGYRLVDTANAYVNDRAVGRGIKTQGDFSFYKALTQRIRKPEGGGRNSGTAWRGLCGFALHSSAGGKVAERLPSA